MNAVKHPDYWLALFLQGLDKNGPIPPQRELLGLMKEFGRPMSLRTLNRHMAALERDGYIKRSRTSTSEMQP